MGATEQGAVAHKHTKLQTTSIIHNDVPAQTVTDVEDVNLTVNDTYSNRARWKKLRHHLHPSRCRRRAAVGRNTMIYDAIYWVALTATAMLKVLLLSRLAAFRSGRAWERL